MTDDIERRPLRRGFSEPPAEAFASLADRIRVPIWIFNREYIVVYANEHTTIFGQGHDLGASLTDFSPEVQHVVKPLLDDCLRSGASLNYEGWVTSVIRGRCYWKLNVVALPDQLTALVVNDWTGRKRAEYELDFSNMRYRQLFESINDGACTISAHGDFEIVNPALERILGAKPDTLAGRNYREFFPPDALPIESLAGKVQQQGQSMTYEVPVRRPDGEVRDLQITLQSQFDVTGEFTCILAMVQDCTLYNHYQRKLEGSEARNRAFLHAVPDLIFLINRQGTFIDYHAKSPEDLAAPPDQLIGRTVHDILPEGLARLTMEKFEEAYEVNGFVIYDYELTVGRGVRRFEARVCPSGKDEALAVIRDVTDQHRTELLLRDSAARYDELLKTVHDGVAIYDADHRIISANPSLVRMLGYRECDLVGTNLLDCFDQPSEFLWLEECVDLQDEEDCGDCRRNEVLLLARDGRTIIAEVSARPVSTGDGSVLWYAVFTDITVQKMIEQELKVSEDEFRMVVNASKDAIVTVDEQGLIRLFNPAAERMFKRRFGTVIGQPLNFLMPENLRDRHAESVRSYFDTGKPDAAIDMTLELPAVTSDGTEFPIELSLSAGSHDQGRFVMATIRDITQRRLMEEALRDSELRYRYIFENVGEGIVFLNATGDDDMVCTLANAAAENLVGVGPGQMNGRSYREIFEPEALAKVEQEVVRRRAGESGKYEVSIRRADGTLRNVVISARPVIDDEGTFQGSFCLLWDAEG